MAKPPAASRQPRRNELAGRESFAGILRGALKLGSFVAEDVSGAFGSKTEVRRVKHILGTAGGWGGLAERGALPIMEGRTYAVRLYQPGSELLDGSLRFPAVEAARLTEDEVGAQFAPVTSRAHA